MASSQEPPAGIEDERQPKGFEHLTCGICRLIFIEPITLNCEHCYCKVCINEWAKTNDDCPLCRKVVENKHGNIALKNHIETLVEDTMTETKVIY